MEGASVAAVCGLGDPVRRELYEYVSRQDQAVGRDEAATEVGIGRPLAAYHLDKLCELGLLTASYRRPAGRGGPGAGRPAKVYARSGREFAMTVPAREYELAGRLLAAAVDADRDGAAGAALTEAARRVGADLGRAVHDDRGLDRPGLDDLGLDQPGRAQAIVLSALAEQGFEPQAGPGGPIRLRNCPFHRLAASYPEVVCGMNLALLDGFIEGLGASGMRPALEPRPDHCCVVIRTRQEPDSQESDDATTGL